MNPAQPPGSGSVPPPVPHVNAEAGPSTLPASTPPAFAAPTTPASFAIPAIPAPGQRALKNVTPQRALKNVAGSSTSSPAIGRYPARQRSKAQPAASPAMIGDLNSRTTRLKLKPGSSSVRGVKLKIKASSRTDIYRLHMGNYGRELDEDPTDPIMFEEQFILRIPEELAEGDKEGGLKGLAELIEAKREIPGLSLRFKDQRRAILTYGGKMYSAKLMDLPTIIEGHKTLDRKRLFKVADICQMLLIEGQIEKESDLKPASNDPDEYKWPHGLTPPLQHVRKRRFRKREIRDDPVGREVARLLGLDAADGVESSSFSLEEGIAPSILQAQSARRQSMTGSDFEFASAPGTPYDAPTPAGRTDDEYDDTRSVGATEADDLDHELDDALAEDDGEHGDGDSHARDTADEDEEEEDDDDLFGDKDIQDDDEDEDEEEEDEEVDEELVKWKNDLRNLDDLLKDQKNALERRKSALTNPLFLQRDRALNEIKNKLVRMERDRAELHEKIETRQAITMGAKRAEQEKREQEQAELDAHAAQAAAEKAKAQGSAHKPASASGSGQAGTSGSKPVADDEMDAEGEEEDAEGEDEEDLFGENEDIEENDEDEDVDMDDQPVGAAASQQSSNASSPGVPLGGNVEAAPAPPAPAPAAKPDWGFEIDEEEEDFD